MTITGHWPPMSELNVNSIGCIQHIWSFMLKIGKFCKQPDGICLESQDLLGPTSSIVMGPRKHQGTTMLNTGIVLVSSLQLSGFLLGG